MPKEFRLSMRNRFGELIALMERANEFLESNALSPRMLYKANLVLEEILTNVMKYAFDDCAFQEIDVLLALSQDKLLIQVVDGGLEFDPLSVPAPPKKESILEMEVGGLGVCLVREMVDSITYRRAESKNILTMTLGLNS